MRDFKIGHYGRLERLDSVTSRKTRVTFYRRPSGTVCFRRVSRREDNGETDKSSCILIVTFLLKLSSQWVKYALACVYIDLAIGEMKKKGEMSEFKLSSRLHSRGLHNSLIKTCLQLAVTRS